MRLFRRKKNNRGFSLVETVCAVAIIGLTSTAIGSAMIMSTDTYQRGNTEVDVQKEAQLATNLIGNLLVGATDASYTGNVLTIYGEGIEYEIIYDPATKKLTYKETKGASVTTGTLAENVTNFKPNLDNWDSMNARIDMAIEKNGRNYEASYNTTARNRASFNVGSAESAFIICETELVLEPGEVYDLPVTIYGNPEVEGINLEASETSLAGPNMGTTFLDDYDDGITIHVDSNASGLFTFVVETAAQKDGIALDAKTVTVKVRRATGINKDAQISGTPLRENTTYRIYADVAADYPDKIIAKEFDDNYVDPHYATFSIVAEGGAVEDLNFEDKEVVYSVCEHTKQNKKNPDEVDVLRDYFIYVGQDVVLRETIVKSDNYLGCQSNQDMITIASGFDLVEPLYTKYSYLEPIMGKVAFDAVVDRGADIEEKMIDAAVWYEAYFPYTEEILSFQKSRK